MKMSKGRLNVLESCCATVRQIAKRISLEGELEGAPAGGQMVTTYRKTKKREE